MSIYRSSLDARRRRPSDALGRRSAIAPPLPTVPLLPKRVGRRPSHETPSPRAPTRPDHRPRGPFVRGRGAPHARLRRRLRGVADGTAPERLPKPNGRRPSRRVEAPQGPDREPAVDLSAALERSSAWACHGPHAERRVGGLVTSRVMLGLCHNDFVIMACFVRHFVTFHCVHASILPAFAMDFVTFCDTLLLFLSH